MKYWNEAVRQEENSEQPEWATTLMETERKNVVLLGGSGGLGKRLSNVLRSDYNVTALSSKDVSLGGNAEEIKEFFKNSNPDIVINLVTVNKDKQIHKLSINEVFHPVCVNLLGNLAVLTSCIEKMRENKYGRIIYMSSFLSKSPKFGTGIYAACKAFNDSLIKTVAIENAKYGITANSILLGYTKFGLAEKVPADLLDKGIQESIIKRPITIEEIANTIKYIIETPCVTGTNLDLSGGLL